MKRENKMKSSLFYEKHLFSFYLKNRILSLKFLICLLLLMIPILQILNDYIFSTNIPIHLRLNQSLLDRILYWEDFIASYGFFLIFLPIIISVDIISEEFSNKSAMILYSTESRNKILFIKLLSLMSAISLLTIIYFSTFLIAIFITTNYLVSIDIFLIGFLFVYLEFIFIASLTFMISALTRNVISSFFLPFLYLILNPFLEVLELGLLSYYSYKMKVFNFFRYMFFQEIIIFSNITAICIIAIFGLPIMIILITFYTFNQFDIRVD